MSRASIHLHPTACIPTSCRKDQCSFKLGPIPAPNKKATPPKGAAFQRLRTLAEKHVKNNILGHFPRLRPKKKTVVLWPNSLPQERSRLVTSGAQLNRLSQQPFEPTVLCGDSCVAACVMSLATLATAAHDSAAAGDHPRTGGAFSEPGLSRFFTHFLANQAGLTGFLLEAEAS